MNLSRAFRRLEGRIRELCTNALAIPQSGEFVVPIVELRNALHNHTDRLRNLAANHTESPQRRRSDLGNTAKLVRCTICGYPVALEMAKVDEGGDAVHEGCYVVELRAEFRSAVPQIPI
jgi:hypothetical protein